MKTVIDAKTMERALVRMAHEILEKHKDTKDIALVGILTRGDSIARRIKAHIDTSEGTDIPYGILDITMYRDDINQLDWHPEVKPSSIGFDVTDKVIILVDDVLYTGRTFRAAIDQIIDFGRPRAIELAVIVDRGHRELPIRADYVGKNIPTAQDEIVDVRVLEIDGRDEVVVRGNGNALD